MVSSQNVVKRTLSFSHSEEAGRMPSEIKRSRRVRT